MHLNVYDGVCQSVSGSVASFASLPPTGAMASRCFAAFVITYQNQTGFRRRVTANHNNPLVEYSTRIILTFDYNGSGVSKRGSLEEL